MSLSATPAVSSGAIRGVMAGRQGILYGGLEIKVRPRFWLRRILPMLPYFESTNPTFAVRVSCVERPSAADAWKPGERLIFRVVYPDNSWVPHEFPVPDHLQPGQKAEFQLPNIFCPAPGRMNITFPINRPGQEVPGWHSLYAYTVHSEETIWYPVVALALLLAGAALQRWLLP